jgi:hypothetical protein
MCIENVKTYTAYCVEEAVKQVWKTEKRTREKEEGEEKEEDLRRLNKLKGRESDKCILCIFNLNKIQ